jgi:CheY-like chemotaxis protein
VRRILIVDDNQDAAESLAILLKLHGHQIHIAHDGLEAVETAAQAGPTWYCSTSACRRSTATRPPAEYESSRGGSTWC